jgi:hypothetical protein
MWFISHNATEIVEFRFNNGARQPWMHGNLSQKVKPWILLLGPQLQQSSDRPEMFVVAMR